MSELFDHFRGFAKSPVLEAISCERMGETYALGMSQQADIDQASIDSLLSHTDFAYAKTLKSVARRDEFLRSRWLMYQALGSSSAIERHRDGTHSWPEGLIGSISHKQGFVSLAFVDSRNSVGLGIDIELVSKMSMNFAERILNESEQGQMRGWVGNLKATDEKTLTIIFSFKESIFKAIYPIGKTMFHFPDAEILTIQEDGTITAKLLTSPSPITPQGMIVYGNYKVGAFENKDLVLTELTI